MGPIFNDMDFFFRALRLIIQFLGMLMADYPVLISVNVEDGDPDFFNQLNRLGLFQPERSRPHALAGSSFAEIIEDIVFNIQVPEAEIYLIKLKRRADRDKTVRLVRTG